MTKIKALDYLNSLNRFGSVLGLDNIRQLLSRLDNPQDKLKIIHVTGTNGKGSVCAFISEILKASGYRTGTYNSPAVICGYDQYKLDCEIISEDAFEKAVSEVKIACDILNENNIYPTRFEVETAAAFVFFLNERVDIAIIETGLGGRDDATAVINNAILHVITAISEDHIPVLGNNISEIAENKSHIIKTCAPTAAFISDDETIGIIKQRCEKYGSPLYSVSEENITDVQYTASGTRFGFGCEDYSLHNITTSLSGAYQPVNAAIAITAARALRDKGYNISDESVLSGIKNAYIPFRFEKICDDPVIIADGAHNPDGAKRLMESLKSIYNGFDFIFVTGMFKDKDCEKICEVTGGIAEKIFAVCNGESERSLDAYALANILKKYNDNVSVCDTIEEGLDKAVTYAKGDKNKITVLFGSLSWLNAARKYYKLLSTGNRFIQ